MKVCTKCKQSKELNNFAKNARRSDGLQGVCKSCQKEYRIKAQSVSDMECSELFCYKCKKTKLVTGFNKSKASKTGHFYWCRDCIKQYVKDKNNKFKEKEGASIYSKRRQDRLGWYRELKKDKSCIDCGTTYEPSCMDYDHVKGEKINHISRMVLNNSPKNKILEEIDKCELVCCLCHNKRTYDRQERADESKLSETQKKNREIIKKAKQKPCYLCGSVRDRWNMQFDHIESSIKFKNISQLQNYKTETLIKEIDKCNIICALCHRRKSLFEQRIGKYVVKKEGKTRKRHIGDTNQECKRCAKILPYSNFSKHKKTKNGYNSWCKSCLNEYKRNRRNGQNCI